MYSTVVHDARACDRSGWPQGREWRSAWVCVWEGGGPTETGEEKNKVGLKAGTRDETSSTRICDFVRQLNSQFAAWAGSRVMGGDPHTLPVFLFVSCCVFSHHITATAPSLHTFIIPSRWSYILPITHTHARTHTIDLSCALVWMK